MLTQNKGRQKRIYSFKKIFGKEKMYESGKSTIQNTSGSDGFYECCFKI